jgi:hypothetical protein
MNIANTIAAMPFLVYGLVDHPHDLTFRDFITGGSYQPSIALNYTSSCYPSYPNELLPLRNFRVETRHSSVMISSYGILPMVLQEQVQPVRNPFVWEGIINIADTPFSGAIRYYAAPLKMAAYNLKSDETHLHGVSYGPSCDEVIELLEGLQVINGRDDVLRQYERQYERKADHQ